MLKSFKRIMLIVFIYFFIMPAAFIIPLNGADNLIYPGVNFGGFSLGGKNQAEVFSLLAEINSEVETRQIILEIDGTNDKITSTYLNMGISLDREKIWLQAFAKGRSGTWWENLWKRWQLTRKPEEIPYWLLIDQTKMQQKLEEMTAPWRSLPLDAELIIKRDDSIVIKEHEYGKEIDVIRAAKELKESAVLRPGEKIIARLFFRTLKPAKLKSDIEALKIEGIAGRCQTTFNAQRVNRTNNIKLAAKALDNCLLPPGAVFSFNDTVGPRTLAKGYDEADIILQNELVPGVGGGVCQVSTTLYNAVLQARLEIIERAPHSMLISYVAPGLDATVVYGARDLKFRNNTSGTLIIKALVYQGNLTVKIFGRPLLGEKVVLKSTKEKEIPPKTIFREDRKVPKGKFMLEQEGVTGYVYKVERFVYDARGKLLRQEFISRNYYPPVDQVIKTAVRPSLLSYFEIL